MPWFEVALLLVAFVAGRQSGWWSGKASERQRQIDMKLLRAESEYLGEKKKADDYWIYRRYW